MMNEVIEAIETHFDDQPDIIIDCMLFLMNSTARVEDVHRIEDWFREHDRCECCGRHQEGPLRPLRRARVACQQPFAR